MTHEKMLETVVGGNPGAMRVVMYDLAWYSDWYEMVKFLFDRQIWGSKIWEHYEDIHHKNAESFAHWIQKNMYQSKEFSHLKKPNNKNADAMVKKHKNDWKF